VDETIGVEVKRTFLLTTSLAALLCAAVPAFADEVPGTGNTFEPRILSSEDVRLYREIIKDEREGHFADAKEDVTKLNDRCLIGYVEAEHLLSPHSKRTPVVQLAAWLDEYNDLPIADRVRALAEKRNNEKRNRHHRVEIASPEYVKRRGGGYEDTDIPDPVMVSDASRTAQPQIAAFVKADQPAQAEDVLKTVLSANVDESDIAHLTRRVSASYLAEGMDADAYRVATAVTRSDYNIAPLLDWDAGLAAYRLGKFQDSAAHFEELAQAGSVPNYTRSAAAFWAARAHIQAGEPLRVVTLLTAAAREEPTFYGMLAERILGQDTQSGFSDPVLDRDNFDALMRVPAAHRAVALSQIGETETISAEMNRALATIDLGHQGQAYAALARSLDLPNLELRASETQASRGVMLTGLFPVPRYKPVGGYSIDPSLVLAFARAESHFQPNAISYAGARGIMQIMPGTAAHMEGTTPSPDQMNDPSYNMGLGQRYLRELLDQVDGNLVHLAAAYNAGPGALTRWMGTHSNQLNDPLLFIESMPVPQTRSYVKEVLTYYWMYSRRVGERAPTLDDTASGKWPRYMPRNSSAPMATTTPQQPSNLLVSDASAPD
jgi:soluble lytic murein transglycosylase-like protein